MKLQGLTDELIAAIERQPKRMNSDVLTSAQFGEMAVIRLLYQSDAALAAGEISERLQMTTSRIAAVLNSLEKKEMIVREADSQDRRRVLVSLTEQGRTRCAAKRQEAREHALRFLQKLGEEDAEQFVRLIKKTMRILSEDAQRKEESNETK